MGYTHYWRLKREINQIPKPAFEVIRDIIREGYDKNLLQREYDDDNVPYISNYLLKFNGSRGDGYEDFIFDTQDTRPNLCKTAKRPYDWHVMAVLIALKYYLGKKFEVYTDGSFDDEWAEVRNICKANTV